MEDTYTSSVGRLLDLLDGFGNRNLSTSSSSSISENQSARLRARTDVLHFTTIFDQTGMPVADPTDTNTWKAFCRKIRSPVDPALGEVEGVHPVMQELMRGCMGRRRDVQLVYEGKSQSEDYIIKKPDMSMVVVNLQGKFSTAIATVAIPIEAKKLGDIQRAIAQGFGYLAFRLKAQVPTVDLRTTTLSGFAVGFDGEYVIIGHVEIVDFKPVIKQTNKMLMWPASGNAPLSETDGVRAVRSLFNATPSQLGMEPASLVLQGNIALQHMLGEGSFGMAIAAHDVNDQTDTFVVKTPNPPVPVALAQVTADQVSHMVTEWQCLRQLSAQSQSPYLPMLRDADTPPSADRPMILMSPVGVPLGEHIAPLKRADRIAFADHMEQHLLAALQHALAQNICHTDIRPDNVVVSGGQAVLIDWGLARPPGSAMHRCRGGLPFFHDDLVIYFYRLSNKLRNDPPIPDLPFSPEFDVASVRFVAAVVKRGYPRLFPPWADGEVGQGLLDVRQEELQKPLDTLFAARANQRRTGV